MNIIQAVEEARQSQEPRDGLHTIQRAGSEDGDLVLFRSTNDERPVTKYRGGQSGFNLTPGDLLADDWEVCDEVVLP